MSIGDPSKSHKGGSGALKKRKEQMSVDPKSYNTRRKVEGLPFMDLA